MLRKWYVVARQDASARWEFLDGAGGWTEEVGLLRRYLELADATVDARRLGGDAVPWEWAMQFAAVEHAPVSADAISA